MEITKNKIHRLAYRFLNSYPRVPHFLRSSLRRKSQRIKIHRLAYRFSIEFSIHTPAYAFFVEITKIWQKSRDFWFADFFLEIFKFHRLVWIFPMDFWLFYICFINVSVKVFTNFKFYKHCFIQGFGSALI